MSEDKSKQDEKEKIFSGLLSEDEKAKIKSEALAEVAAEAKKKLAEEYKKSIKDEATKKALMSDAKTNGKGDKLQAIFIDLPAVAECIRLNGVAYYPGRTYQVTQDVAEVLSEIMGRGFAHEDEVSGRKDANAGRNKRNSIARLS